MLGEPRADHVCTKSAVRAPQVQAITEGVQEEMCKCYPEAKLAHVKNGGNFPYLSRDQEVNM
jgi:hypothetical protein